MFLPFLQKNGQALIFKSGTKILSSIRTINKYTNKPPTTFLYEDTFRFVGDQNEVAYFDIANHAQFDLTLHLLSTNKDEINKFDQLRQFQTIVIERNKILGCAMILEEYITDRGSIPMFTDERSRYFGEIKIRFDRVFGVTSTLKIDYCCIPISHRRTETDGGGVVCDGTSRALLLAGRFLEQVRYK